MGNKDDYLPLFETKAARGRVAFRCYTASILVAICFIFTYRLSHFPMEAAGKLEKWTWLGLSLFELWFSFYWFIAVVVRWNPLFRRTFKDRLSLRYNDGGMPRVDVFVCTADPILEPPMMVVNTVLSLMAYDYPTEKLAVYLSDDGGSVVTFYAMLEAARFAEIWLPFCRMLKVEPRSPEAYFLAATEPPAELEDKRDWFSAKEFYEEMKMRIQKATATGDVPVEIRREHPGFRHWDFVFTRRDHPTVLQILIDGREVDAMDTEGQRLPTMVYLAREKRPNHPHNFKAGAMNALIRVSSRISNGPIILNLDCDMYSNNSASVRDALCFFMNEQEGHEIAFVQYPQKFDNLTKNEIYSGSLRVIMDMELHGFDGNGGSPFIGTGCFHRREVLCGAYYVKGCKTDWEKLNAQNVKESKNFLEDECRDLASCTYEENTLWGTKMGLTYGCIVEDILTGLSIQYRGWRSIYFNPERTGFLGLAATTLPDALAQRKRWAEGDLQIFLSKHCPFVFGHGKIPLKLQLSYCIYLLWAANCFAYLYYIIVPPLCLLKGISLFPKVSSPWVMPFVYSFFATHAYNLGEFLWCGGTFLGWWNDQRMWMFTTTTSYLLAFLGTILKLLKFSQSAFVITAKVVDGNVSQRYEQEVMEFGVSSPMFDISALLAMLNLCSYIFLGIKMVVMDHYPLNFDLLALQVILCSLVVSMNWPIYKGLFLRRDNGAIPALVTYKSIALALIACTVAIY